MKNKTSMPLRSVSSVILFGTFVKYASKVTWQTRRKSSNILWNKIDAIMRFADNFDVVLSAFQDISKDADIAAKTRTKAMSLINAISSASFVMWLAAAKNVVTNDDTV